MAMLGSGTAEDPYLITTAQDLRDIDNAPSAYYSLLNDIELTGEWIPLRAFSGSLEGNGHEIHGLEFSDVAGLCGLFTQFDSARVKELVVATSELGLSSTGSNYMGILVGNMNGGCKLYRVMVRGRIRSTYRVGGLAGRAASVSSSLGAEITECGAFVEMSSGTNVGALVGYPYSGWSYTANVFSNQVVSGSGGTRISAPDAVSEYPIQWDWKRTYEIVNGYPAFRTLSQGSDTTHGFDLPDADGATVAATVRVDSLPARRRVVAVSQANQVVETPLGQVVQPVVVGAGVTDDSGVVEISLTGYVDEVFLLALDDWPAEWAPEETYAVGDLRRPSVFAGVTYECIAEGVGPATEPAWWPYSQSANNGYVGTALFRARRYYRPLAHGPIRPEVSTE